MSVAAVETPLQETKPYYLPVGNEEAVFEAAFRQRLPVLLKGPTGVGKTRFVEHMAAKLSCELITVACHEDLTAADLVGRYILQGDATVWVDGPLTRAVKTGAILYLDEVVEARSDTIVVLHPLTDHRRELHIERLNETHRAHDGFMVVMSYNPGYQTLLKDLKASTRQRLVALEFDFPPPHVEKAVLVSIYGIEPHLAERLVRLGGAIRRLESPGLSEAASTRALVATGLLVSEGLSPVAAATAALANALSDDRDVIDGLSALIHSHLG
jgi:nitric oxide reductase NorQ protein